MKKISFTLGYIKQDVYTYLCIPFAYLPVILLMLYVIPFSDSVKLAELNFQVNRDQKVSKMTQKFKSSGFWHKSN